MGPSMPLLTDKSVFPDYSWDEGYPTVDQLPLALLKSNYTEFWLCNVGGCALAHKTVMTTMFYTASAMAAMQGNYYVNIHWSLSFHAEILSFCALENTRNRKCISQHGVWTADHTAELTEAWAHTWEGEITRTCLVRDSIVAAVDGVARKLERCGLQGDDKSKSPEQTAWLERTQKAMLTAYGATRDAKINIHGNDVFGFHTLGKEWQQAAACNKWLGVTRLRIVTGQNTTSP